MIRSVTNPTATATAAPLPAEDVHAHALAHLADLPAVVVASAADIKD